MKKRFEAGEVVEGEINNSQTARTWWSKEVNCTVSAIMARKSSKFRGRRAFACREHIYPSHRSLTNTQSRLHDAGMV